MHCGYVENIPIVRKCTQFLVVKDPNVWNPPSYGSKEKEKDRERANAKANGVKC